MRVFGGNVGKLWEKNYNVDALLEEFTVGQDYLLDRNLTTADCLGSMAHAKMLVRIGILTQQEEASLHMVLAAIIHEYAEGKFSVFPQDEDCHTAIENRLTSELGEAGKKIHTGRSRNDQVLTALRLYGRNYSLDIAEAVCRLVETLLVAAEKNKDVPMPGRTHTQIAMPSSAGLWFSAWAEELLDGLDLLRTVYRLGNRCPLGAAASYGTPLPLDREYTSELLGFEAVHNNVLAANNSRGRLEACLLDALDSMGITLSKMAADLIMFSLPEFGYFSLPAEMCTGSSIMPQKKNPDGLELTRAKAAVLGSCAFEIKSIIRALPSGYNRDFQETKEPFMRGLKTALSLFRIMDRSVRKLEVNPDALRRAFTPDIFAADEAYTLVRAGRSFRDAYREVGLNLDKLKSRDPMEALKNRTSSGTAGNLRLQIPRGELSQFISFFTDEKNKINACFRELCGFAVKIPD
jgi:argininosuccinate lyase